MIEYELLSFLFNDEGNTIYRCSVTQFWFILGLIFCFQA